MSLSAVETDADKKLASSFHLNEVSRSSHVCAIRAWAAYVGVNYMCISCRGRGGTVAMVTWCCVECTEHFRGLRSGLSVAWCKHSAGPFTSVTILCLPSYMYCLQLLPGIFTSPHKAHSEGNHDETIQVVAALPFQGSRSALHSGQLAMQPGVASCWSHRQCLFGEVVRPIQVEGGEGVVEFV